MFRYTLVNARNHLTTPSALENIFARSRFQLLKCCSLLNARRDLWRGYFGKVWVASFLTSFACLAVLLSARQVHAQVTFPDNQPVATAEGQAHPPGLADMLFKMLPMFVMVFFIFYFMVMKPQQQRLKSQKELLESLKKGESVVTSGGILGKIAGIEGELVLIEVAPNVRIRVEATHIARKVEKPGADKSAAANS